MQQIQKLYLCLIGRPLRAVYLYRLSFFFYKKKFKILGQIFWNLNLVLHNLEIAPTAKIGKNFKIAHTPGVVIGGGCLIGDNVTIYQNVTLGADKEGNYPTIGNNVTIYPGAVVIGKIIIENSVTIGANAFVNKSVLFGSTVAGVPAKVIKTGGDK